MVQYDLYFIMPQRFMAHIVLCVSKTVKKLLFLTYNMEIQISICSWTLQHEQLGIDTLTMTSEVTSLTTGCSATAHQVRWIRDCFYSLVTPLNWASRRWHNSTHYQHGRAPLSDLFPFLFDFCLNVRVFVESGLNCFMSCEYGVNNFLSRLVVPLAKLLVPPGQPSLSVTFRTIM